MADQNRNLDQYVKQYIDEEGYGFIHFGGDLKNYYLYEIYLEERNGHLLYNGEHSSRGYPDNVNISDIIGGCYEDIFYYVINKDTNRHNSTFYNLIVYGCFYGWYCYPRMKPFDIHSPYELDINGR